MGWWSSGTGLVRSAMSREPMRRPEAAGEMEEGTRRGVAIPTRIGGKGPEQIQSSGVGRGAAERASHSSANSG